MNVYILTCQRKSVSGAILCCSRGLDLEPLGGGEGKGREGKGREGKGRIHSLSESAEVSEVGSTGAHTASLLYGALFSITLAAVSW